MPAYTSPSIDLQNPCYCPAVSATSYADNLRRRLLSQAQKVLYPRSSDELLYNSFARILIKSLQDDAYILGKPSKSATPLIRQNRDILSPLSPLSVSNLHTFSPPEPGNTTSLAFNSSSLTLGDLSRLTPGDASFAKPLPAHHLPALKRKHAFSPGEFSGIEGPSVYGRSFESAVSDAFEIEVHAKRIRYDDARDAFSPFDKGEQVRVGAPAREEGDLSPVAAGLAQRVRVLEDELYGPPIGTESPRGIQAFIARLDALMPGIRLRERLSEQDGLSHQSITDMLSDNGYLNAQILDVLRTSEIYRLSLAQSLLDEDGLNLSGLDVLPVFSKPHSFLFLQEVAFNGTFIQDVDLIHITRLPRLACLKLNNTGIGNEAIFLLVALKRTLTHLSITTNPDIDDDAIPALLLLTRLVFLSIVDTNIDMPGLRRLAGAAYDNDRALDIQIPTACELYIDNMHTKYCVNPPPPLITDPRMCAQLSLAALRRNLAAHAACCRGVVATGTKAEMCARLKGLLEAREMDLLVREMIIGDDSCAA